MTKVAGADRHVPTKYVGEIEPNWHCRGWNAKRLKYCKLRAGSGTSHVGEGRCKYHNGNAVTRHGIYSRIKRKRIRELIAEHEANPDPLNILPELATARALFEDYINRYEVITAALLAWHESYRNGEDGAKPRQVLDIADAYRLISEITKIVARIEKIRADDAISRSELYRIMGEMGRVVETFVPDMDALQEIKRAWLAIRA
jgi:hypothetical protein